MEEIGEILSRGFGVWKSNLNLCIPFGLSFLASVLIFLPLLAAVALIIMAQEDLSYLNQTTLQDPSAMQETIDRMVGSLESLPTESILEIAGIYLVMIVLGSLVDSFFTAGAVGMARQALDEGRSDSSTIWPVGRRHFLGLFVSRVIMGLLVLAGLVFLLPALAIQPQNLLEDPGALGVLAAGAILFVVYLLVLSLALALLPYALVLENMRPLQAVFASVDFFRYNKFDVAVIWLVMAALSIALEMIAGISSPGEGEGVQLISAITSIANLLVLSPLFNLWWTMLYMSRRGMLKTEEVKDPW